MYRAILYGSDGKLIDCWYDVVKWNILPTGTTSLERENGKWVAISPGGIVVIEEE